MAVLELARAGGNGLVHVPGAEDSRKRGVARAEGLPERDDVGNERDLVVGEPGASPSEAGDDLVEDDQEAVPVTPLGKTLPESLRRRVAG